LFFLKLNYIVIWFINKEKNMKKTLLVVVAFLSFSFAQEASSSPWGIYGGLTSAGTSDSDGRISGLSIGGSYTINEKWSAGAGLSVRGGKYDIQDEESGMEGTAELKGDALELWTSYSLMQSESFGLSTGLIYANIYSTKIKFMGLTFDEDEYESDYGLFLNGSIPLRENLGLNIGYYMGLKDLDDDESANNLWIEVGYSF